MARVISGFPLDNRPFHGEGNGLYGPPSPAYTLSGYHGTV